jgi:SAM-dependent methyltransferase
MHQDTARRLVELNHQFYQTFAAQFSATRRRLQPGVRRVIKTLPPGWELLDLGCGNGELARALAGRGRPGSYTGLDFSAGLLAEADGQPSPRSAGFAGAPLLPEGKGLEREGGIRFLQADLAAPGWEAGLGGAMFDAALAFAVLHHLPGADLRRRVAQTVRARLRPGGRFIHSNWQFLESPRLRLRILDWGRLGLSPGDVEPGDYLLDWRGGVEAGGEPGLRYVHHFTPGELAALAAEAGFGVLESFVSDGENGRLGLYQIWEAASSAGT